MPPIIALLNAGGPQVKIIGAVMLAALIFMTVRACNRPKNGP